MRVGFVFVLPWSSSRRGARPKPYKGRSRSPACAWPWTRQVTVGGRLRLTVAVEHDPEAAVQWPDSLDLGPFEVLEAGAVPPLAKAIGW